MKNYIFTIVFCTLALTNMAQTTSQNYILKSTKLDANAIESIDVIQYYDGLGRPSQSVCKNGSKTDEQTSDLITLVEYDSYGREYKKWLPTSIGSDAVYVAPSSVQSAAGDFYGDIAPYTKSVYESSPLNRIIEQYGAGSSFGAVTTNSLTNSSLYPCCRYYLDGETLKCSENYKDGQLLVTKKTDEDGHISYEFKDKLGRVVLIRQADCDTYYVYDNYGQLRYVLPPKISGDLSPANLNALAYQYKYDSRNRCIEKKLPGCEPVYMRYDKADNLIFTQDGVQRAKSTAEWTFFIYDKFKRLVLSGTCTNSTTSVDAVSGVIVGNSFTASDSGIGNTGYSISNLSLTSPTVLQANFYDNYNFLTLSGFSSRSSNFPGGTVNATGYQTGRTVAYLDGSGFIYSALYYDIKGQPTYTVSTNHLGGYEKNTTSYTFSGKPETLVHQHSAAGKNTVTEYYNYNYDTLNRLLSTTHSMKIDNGTQSASVQIACNSYDEVGRLKARKINAASDTIRYTYNIRSWLKSISSSKFSQNLYYDETTNGNTPCKNGNISAMNWKVKNDFLRGYNFEYDNLNRVTKANYLEAGVESDHYNTSYGYDKMGNITSLTRNGLSDQPSVFGTIDNLTLNYNGNQLVSVDDAATEPLYTDAFNFVDGTTNSLEYEYDANGNLTQDSNKGIAKIQYNILNLPKSIFFVSKDTTECLYDAGGIKRRVFYKTGEENPLVSLGTTLTTSPNILENTWTDYCGNVIYENGTLSRILVNGGYITMNGTTPTYHYYIQDHQGNNRVVFNQNGTIEQASHYYPFGMTFGEGINNPNNRYKYNGKELDRMHGLDLYDYGARLYDAAIGRWGTEDALAELSVSKSPYIYCSNNPINRIDPTGLYDLPEVVVVGHYPTTNNSNYYHFMNIMSYSNRFIGGTTNLGDLGKSFINGYDLINNDRLRHTCHVISKTEFATKRGLKSGKMFQKMKALTSISSKLSRAVNGLGFAGDILSAVQIYDDLSDGSIKPSSIYSGTTIAVGIGVGIFAGPEIAAGLAVYGFADAVFDIGGRIDKMNDDKEIKILDK